MTVAQPDTATVAAAPIADLKDISKRFGATQALDGVSLELEGGEIHGLVGENGAGKSTLVKILAGIHRPDRGTMLLDGKPIVLQGPAQSRALGIAVVHQEPQLFPDLSVAENVFIGHAPRSNLGLDWGRMERDARGLFDQLEVAIHPGAKVRGLSMADQQLIEIARALSLDSRILVLDEPTASLSAHEVAKLFSIVRETKRRGVAVLFVSHRLEEVFELTDRTSVFRDGRNVVTAETSSLTPADLIRHMVGREVTLYPEVSKPIGDPLLEVSGLGKRDEFQEISFEVRQGEIVGMAGLVGAGRTEIARVLFGITRADEGEILLEGRAVSFGSPAAALDAGVAYLPEDRHAQGLVLDFPITSNVTLPILRRLFPRLLVRPAVERKLATEYGGELDIRMQSVDDLAASLSGGNQQKVVLAKWLAAKPRVLILDEPTRGIDIGAKVEVHRIIFELAASGLGIILISSDLPEVLAMSDRILVLHEGRLTATIDGKQASEEQVMFAATGQNGRVEPEQPGVTAG